MKTKTMTTIKKPTYYINVHNVAGERDEFIQCPSARPLNIPGFDNYHFFVHKSYAYSEKAGDTWSRNKWAVSEATTGYFIHGTDRLSYEDAITTAVALLINHRRSFLENMKKTEKLSPFPGDDKKDNNEND